MAKTARKWQIQEAKNRLSEVIELALKEGPQTVTRRGEDVVVIVSKADFDRTRRSGKRGSFYKFMRGLSFVGADLDLERSSEGMREVDL
jgi:prevent-host-death family protein